MYCIRNGIQTIELREYDDPTMDYAYCQVLMHTWMKRGEERHSEKKCKYVTYYSSPYCFYKYCPKNLYAIDAVEDVVRNHMRRKCPKPATFLDEVFPF